MFGIIRKTSLIVPVMALTMGMGVAQASASVVFEDHMDNLNNWTSNPTGAKSLVTSDSTVTHEPYMKLNNGVTYAQIGQTLTQDWTLTLKLRHTAYRRGLGFGLFDAAGQKGYLGWWDSSNSVADGGDGDGFTRIRKVDLSSGEFDFGSAITNLTTTTPSTGHTATGPDFATMSLSWKADTGTLTLSVDGVQKQQVTDTNFDHFSRIYLRGNTYGEFDDVKLTSVPEPGSLALLSLGGVVMLSRKRRR